MIRCLLGQQLDLQSRQDQRSNLILHGEDIGQLAVVALRPHMVAGFDIDELCGLLECQNLAALDKFCLVSPSLSQMVGAVRFERLRDAIDNLNFQLGAELLRESLLVGRHEKGVGLRSTP
jgi:hypothetical protein